MRSVTEPPASPPVAPHPRRLDRLLRWNRRLHSWVGLYLLFFVWLFALSGLLLNHPQWSLTGFWESRKQVSYERDLAWPAPDSGGDLDRARQIMAQLGLAGEIDWTTRPSDGNRFDFRITRPGHILEVRTDRARQRATVQQIDVNLWGVARMLHTFTGVRLDDERNRRDWVLTKIWAFAMDAVAAGMGFLVLGGVLVWYERAEHRAFGFVALGLGVVSCSLFCVGLRWLF